MQEFDLIVIGGGRASHLARNAAKKGKKVALIEKSTLGGTCANRGCVPSKLLIGYADVIDAIQKAKQHYIDANIDNIDIVNIFEKTNEYISTVDANYEKEFNDNVTLFRGKASFKSNKIIAVNNRQLTAKHIVIATGSRPVEAPHEKAWTSDDIFPLLKIPKSIAIVGAGSIAVELANFFAAVGIETKLFARKDHLLSKEDEDIRTVFKKEFTKSVTVAFNTTVANLQYDAIQQQFDLDIKTKGKEIATQSYEAVLYAIGRKSNADTLNLKATDIELDDKGFIKRDRFFQTAVKNVYVVGDAAGEYMLQHAAAHEVNHLEKYLYKDKKEPLQFKYMPHAVFCEPEVASVGMTQETCEKHNIEYVASTTNWLASAKAQAMKVQYPLTKFLIDPHNYEILGCHLIGPQSSTMIHQVLAVMHIDNDIRHLKQMLYIHPALSEALLPAAIEAIKEVQKYKKTTKTKV